MSNEEKLSFLKNDFIDLLKKLKGNEKPQWGVLNPQQMIEHMGDSFRLASGKIQILLVTPAEKLEAMNAYAVSDKEFKPNTKNPIMSETPAPVKFDSIETAINKLIKAVTDFETYWQSKQETDKLLNPFFGDLNFEGQTQLLYKHARHHLKQFGLIE